MTDISIKKEIREMVKYILPEEEHDEDVIENYVESLFYSHVNYHLSKLNEITEKDILDNYKAISDHTTYDYVKGAKDLRNKYLNNQ